MARAHDGQEAAEAREASRWFIKDKDLEEQIRACRKSLAAAEKSGKANIAKSLEAKLQGLLSRSNAAPERGGSAPPLSPKKKPEEQLEAEEATPAAKPPKAGRVTKTTTVVTTTTTTTTTTSTRTREGKKKKVLRKKRRTKADSEEAGDDDDNERGADPAQREAAIQLLLRGMAKARTGGEDEDSDIVLDVPEDEEARLLAEEGELEEPTASRGASAAASSSSPAAGQPPTKKARKAKAEDVKREGEAADAAVADEPVKEDAGDDDEFFDLSTVKEVKDNSSEPQAANPALHRESHQAVDPELMAGSPTRGAGKLSAAGETRQRRRAHRQLTKERAEATHPSWVASKTPWVSGAIGPRGAAPSGRHSRFASDEEIERE